MRTGVGRGGSNVPAGRRPRERRTRFSACLRIPAANSGSASAGTSARARSTSGNLVFLARQMGRGRYVSISYRSSSCNSSRWSVSSALRCSLSSASNRARAISSTRAQNASVPAFFKKTQLTQLTASGVRTPALAAALTPFWNCARRSRLRRSNSPDFLNL